MKPSHGDKPRAEEGSWAVPRLRDEEKGRISRFCWKRPSMTAVVETLWPAASADGIVTDHLPVASTNQEK